MAAILMGDELNWRGEIYQPFQDQSHVRIQNLGPVLFL